MENNPTSDNVYDSIFFQILSKTCNSSYLPMDFQQIFVDRFSLVLTLCNIILNGCCLKIFFHKIWRKSTMSILLKWLSLVEVLFASSIFLSKLQPEFEPDELPIAQDEQIYFLSDELIFTTNVKQKLYFYTFHKIIMFLACFTQIIRNWTVALLAGYRYDAVCRPIGKNTYFTKKYIYIMLTLVTLISIIGTIPRIFETKFIICPINGVSYTQSFLSDNTPYQIYYTGIFISIIQNFGPLTLISILSVFVIKKISQRKENKRLRQAQTEPIAMLRPQNSMTKSTTEKFKPSSDFLVLLLCLVFFVTETPAFFSKVLEKFLTNEQSRLFGNISNTLILIDSTLNFFVYMGSNPNFRSVSYELILKDCRKFPLIRNFLSYKESTADTENPNTIDNLQISPDKSIC